MPQAQPSPESRNCGGSDERWRRAELLLHISQDPERGLGPSYFAKLSLAAAEPLHPCPLARPTLKSFWPHLSPFSPKPLFFQPQSSTNVPSAKCLTKQQNQCPKAPAGPRQQIRQHSPGRWTDRQADRCSPLPLPARPAVTQSQQAAPRPEASYTPLMVPPLASDLWLEMRGGVCVCVPWVRYFEEESY